MKPGYTYMLLILPSFRVKVGYTKKLDRRISNISESLKWQFAIPVCLIYSRDYKSVEKIIHRVFGFARYEFKGSGKTEYFRTIVSPLIWVFMVILQIMEFFWFLLKVALAFAVIVLLYYLISK